MFYTTNDWVKIHYEINGKADDEDDVPLILIHGWSGSTDMFKRNVNALSAHRRVIRFDLRGHGRSDKPHHGFHVARLAADLRGLMDFLEIRSAYMLGCALGSAVIWSFVELFGTDRVSKAILVDQAPLQAILPDGTWTMGSKTVFDGASAARVGAMLETDPDTVYRANVRAGLTRNPNGDDTKHFVKLSKKSDAKFLAKLMDDQVYQDWRGVLPLMEMPTLVVAGGVSKVFPVDGVAECARLIPKAQLEVFENGGHWLFYEEADRFNQLVEDFLF